MKKKYNLALMPLFKSEEIIGLATCFANIADQYLLGENSLPHITLYQFYYTESKIAQLWKTIQLLWEEPPIEFLLETFSCTTRDNLSFWVSLMPNKRDLLFEMHALIASYLQLPLKQSFDPHLTLFNTKNKEYEKTVAKSVPGYKIITDKFVLGLGECDEIGQFTQLIDRF